MHFARPTSPHARPSPRGLAVLTAGIALLGIEATPTSAQAQTIVVTTRNATYQTLSTIPGITSVTSNTSCQNGDDCLSTSISIPFSFRYYGTGYTSLQVDSNGWLAFAGGASFSNLSNTTIPSSGTPNTAIFAWWDDNRNLNLNHGVLGTSPNRIFIVELEFRHYTVSSGTNSFVQWWLYESPNPSADGIFEVYYGGGYTNPSSGASATIGFENSAGSVGTTVASCSPSCSDFANRVNTVWRAGAPDNPELFPTFPANAFPRGAFPGNSAVGSYSVNNIGVNTANVVNTDFWLSVDNTFSTTADIRVGTATIASVPNGVRTATVSIRVPSTLAPGDYFLFARTDANRRFPELDENDNVRAAEQRFATAYELAGADCRVTNPRGANPGDTLDFELTLTNNGVPYVGALGVQVRASRDATFDSTDPIIGSTQLPFSGANTERGVGSIVLPTSGPGTLAPGRYFLICEVDPTNAVTETNESNNIVVGATAWGSGPDLAVSSVTFPQQIRPGTTVNVTTTVDNLGVPFAGTVQYRLWASVNAVLEAATDIDLGTYEATFNRDDRVADVEAVTFSAAIPGGRYRIIAVADPRTRVAEVDETNNTVVSERDFVNAIDFAAVRATVTRSGSGGSGVQAGDRLQATGTADSIGLSFVGNVPYGIFFSADATFDGADEEAYRGLIFFPGNTSGSINVTFQVPSVPPGTYNILFVINPNNNPPEAARSNNFVTATGGGTQNVLGADLRVESLTAPTFAFIGRTMEVTMEIRNDSAAGEARGFQYVYVLSDDEIIRVFDPQVFLSGTATLAPSSSQVFVDQVPIPTEIATSTRSMYLGVIVDIYSRVPETNENNNIRRTAAPISLLFPIPDLSGQIVTTATSAAGGEQLAVTRLITNSGVADATNFDVAYYLSQNPTIATDDILLGTVRETIPSQADDYAIDVVTVPAGIVPGTYFLGMILDPNEQLDEVTRANNTVLGPALPVFQAAIRFTTDRLKNGVVGARYEEGVYARGGPVPITWSVTRGALPPGIALDAASGLLSGTPTTEGVFEFTLRASSGTAFTERTFSVRMTSPTVRLAIATQTVRSAIAGRPYAASLVGVGGTRPYQWRAVSELPLGLELTLEGVLQGTPVNQGQYDMTIRVTDDLGASVSSQLRLNVVGAGGSVRIQQIPIPDAIVGQPYCSDTNKFAFTASNGIQPYVWSSTGSIPPGMTFNEMGELCGTPTRAGVYDFTLRAQDSTGLFDAALFRLTVQGGEECAIATFTLPNGRINSPYSAGTPEEEFRQVDLDSVSCADPVTWSLVEGGGSLPPGIELTAAGLISGTPTQVGAYAFLVRIADGSGSTAVQPLSIEVEGIPQIIPAEDDGCTCTTRTPDDAPLAWLALLPALALVLRRRR